jgi:carbon monoxide dehydrogenase subunit G
MIELAGEYEFAAPQELLWEMLFDPEVLAGTMPGCEKLERIDDKTLQGRLNIKIGPVQGVFQGKVESSDVHPPSSFHIIVSGNGPAGIVRGEGNVTLEALAATTRLRYDGTAQVSGRIAGVGQRVMDSSAKSIVKQSLQSLENQIQARLSPVVETADTTEGETATVPVAAPAPRAVAAPAPPGQAEFMINVARDVAQDVLADLIPDPGQRKLAVGAGLVVVVLALLNLFANLVARRVAKILKES